MSEGLERSNVESPLAHASSYRADMSHPRLPVPANEFSQWMFTRGVTIQKETLRRLGELVNWDNRFIGNCFKLCLGPSPMTNAEFIHPTPLSCVAVECRHFSQFASLPGCR